MKSWYLDYVRTGRLTKHFKPWGPETKARIIAQKPLIRQWRVDCLDYRDIPDRDAHWHIDPPYQGSPGREYTHSEIDYAHLAEWCRSRTGAVDVCENEGADWLDFAPLYEVTAQRNGRKSREAVWRKDAGDLFAR